MFFKHTLQVITGVTLKDTLKEELAYIEKKKKGFLEDDILYNDYQQWRMLTITAYRTKTEVKNTLEIAKRLQTEPTLLQAYNDAKKADEANASVLGYKLNKALYPQESDLNFFLFSILPGAAALLLVVMIKIKFHLSSEEATTWIVGLIFIIYAPSYLRAIIVALCIEKRLESILIESFWCKAVLAEAKKIDIDLNADLKSVFKNQPWSNAQLLADIQHETIPDEYLCNISLCAMTQPVYALQHNHRYEKSAIDTWLCQKNIHPITDAELYWDDLIPDTELSNTINRFTHDKVAAYIQHETMIPILESVEMNAEDKHANQLNR